MPIRVKVDEDLPKAVPNCCKPEGFRPRESMKRGCQDRRTLTFGKLFREKSAS